MRFTMTAGLTMALLLAAPASSAWAQTEPASEPVVACPTQSELEQAISSSGSIIPEECTTLQVNSLTSDNGELCLIDFGLDEGFIGRLRDAAFPSQWWVRCDALASRFER